MHSKTILASGLALISAASARVTGFYVPSTVDAQAPVEILIRAENYIQKVQDVKFDFGFDLNGEHNTLNTYTFALEQANTMANISFPVSIPSFAIGQDITITGTLDQLYGASQMPITEQFEAKVTVSRGTTGPLISSTQTYSK